MNITITGVDIDEQGRCTHYHSVLDVVAIRLACCPVFYACHRCHDALSGHGAVPWPADHRREHAVLCGVCRHTMPIDAYLASGNACPSCDATFNPGCEVHHPLYFSVL